MAELPPFLEKSCKGGPREGTKVRTPPPPPPPRKITKMGFLSNTGADLLKKDLLKNHKATKPAFNVGPVSVMARLYWYFYHSLPSSTKRINKRCRSWTPSDIIFWIRACLLIIVSSVLLSHPLANNCMSQWKPVRRGR